MPRARKTLKVIFEIDIHAVTCPGVWLSGHGDILLHVCFIGFHTRTKSLYPKFPLLFHERLLFEKTFLGCSLFHHLESTLSDQFIYLELLQECGRNSETVLAAFETSALEILYPYHNLHSQNERVDVDLLMEPTRDFPGILSPKVEVSVKTTVTETRNPLKDMIQDSARNLTSGNQHTLSSHSRTLPSAADLDTKKKSRSSSPPQRSFRNKDTRPPFVVRHVDSRIFSRFLPLPKRHSVKKKDFLSKSTGHLNNSGDDVELKRTPRRASAPAISQIHHIPKNSSYSWDVSAESNHERNITESSVKSGRGNNYRGSEHYSSISRKQPEHEAPFTENCPRCYSNSEHRMHRCTVCRLYREYFGEDYTGHMCYAHNSYNKHKGLMILSQDGGEHHRSRKYYSWDHSESGPHTLNVSSLHNSQNHQTDRSQVLSKSFSSVNQNTDPDSSPYRNRGNERSFASVIHDNVHLDVNHNQHPNQEDGYDSHDEHHLCCSSHEQYLDSKYPKQLYSRNYHYYPVIPMERKQYWPSHSLYTGKSHRQLFYENLEKFYHKMYRRAQAKAVVESSRL